MHFFPRRGWKAWCFGLTTPNSKVIASWVEIPCVKVNERISQGVGIVIPESRGLMVVQSQGILQGFSVNPIAVTNPEASAARQQFIICLLAFVANMMGHEPLGSGKWGTSGQTTLRRLMGRATASLLSTLGPGGSKTLRSSALMSLLFCFPVKSFVIFLADSQFITVLPPSSQIPPDFPIFRYHHFSANYSLAHSWAPWPFIWHVINYAHYNVLRKSHIFLLNSTIGSFWQTSTL